MSESGIYLERQADQINQEIGNKEVEEMLSFVGVYPKDEIRRDIKKVWEAERHFREKNQMLGANKMGEKFGDNMEFLLDKCGEQNNWFGENSFISKTLKYDDYFNGVDFVLEYDLSELNNSPQRVAIMVDCTSSREKIDKKISNNLRSMELGKTRVKYFESQVDSFKGEVVCVPVVIGLNEEHINQLMDNIGNNNYLANSSAQVVFLEEIRMQLRLYRQFLSTKKSDFFKTLLEIEAIQKIIGGVVVEKQELVNLSETKEYMLDDDVCRETLLIVEQKRNLR